MLDPHQLIDTFNLESSPPTLVTNFLEEANKQVVRWKKQSLKQQKVWLNNVLSRIEVNKEQLTIDVDLNGFVNELIKEQLSLKTHHRRLTTAIKLQRCGLELRLVIEGNAVPATSDSVKAIQSALKQSLEWNHLLDSGECDSIQAVADRHRVSPAYVRRICKLSLLAPDLMSKIIEGDVPLGMTLERLKTEFPLDWEHQQRVFVT